MTSVSLYKMQTLPFCQLLWLLDTFRSVIEQLSGQTFTFAFSTLYGVTVTAVIPEPSLTKGSKNDLGPLARK